MKSKKQIRDIRRLYTNGTKVANIAKKHNIGHSTVYNYISPNRYTCLTDKEIRQVIHLYNNEYGYGSIAKIFGCSLTTIKKYIKQSSIEDTE